MKKLLCIAVALFSASGMYAFAFREYNRLLDEAARAFSEKNFSAAALFYDSAFALNERPIAMDLEAALKAALELRNFSRAFGYARRLAALGVGPAYFERKTAWKGLRKQAGWEALLKDAAANRQAIEERNRYILAQLRQLRESALDIQTVYRKTKYSYDDQKNFLYQRDSVAAILFNIFAKEGYLSEYRIGVTMLRDTLIAEPIFADILLFKRLHPAPPQLFELVDVEPSQSLILEYIRSGWISTRFAVKALKYHDIAAHL